MPITDADFAALVTLIEDGELDDRMTALIVAIDERNERRKGEIQRLVESVWGRGAKVVGGESTSLPPSKAPSSEASAVPPGMYLGQDGNLYPLPDQQVSAGQGDEAKRAWPPPVSEEPQAADAVLGVQPARDAMGGNFGDGNPDIVSTGAQITRYER